MPQPPVANDSLILARALERRLIDGITAAELILEQESSASMALDLRLLTKGLITPEQRRELIEGLGSAVSDDPPTRCLPSADPPRSQTGVQPTSAPRAPDQAADQASTQDSQRDTDDAGVTNARNVETSLEHDSHEDRVSTLYSSKSSSSVETPSNSPTEEGRPDRYNWQDEHARGGLGAVWRGWDRNLERTVALKTLLPKAARSAKMRERFVDEAKITGQLEHPGVVPVYDLGLNESGQTFYAMRMLAGHTMTEALKKFHAILTSSAEARLQRHTLLQAFVSVCSTLEFAHQQRILHRDLKPSNVILGNFGEVLVVDWGLAKQLPEAGDEGTVAVGAGGDRNSSSKPTGRSKFPSGNRGSRSSPSTSRTMHGEILGTPLYMSPEQAAGRTNLKPTSDVFSLGVMLYEILTGEKAFAGEDTQTIIDKVRRLEFEKPRAVSDHVCKPLEAICLKAMSAAPKERYASARQLGEDVSRYLAGEPVSVYPESRFEKLQRWAGHHRSLVASTIAGAILVAIVATVSCLLINSARQAENKAKQKAENAYNAEREARQLEEAAKRWALDQVTQTREAADAWLINWSGDLQFYPGLAGVRTDLLQKAEAHYQQTLAQSQGKEDFAVVVEASKSAVRLGDVRRLLKREDARAAYETAEQLLDKSQSEPATADPELIEGARLQKARSQIGQALCGLESAAATEQELFDAARMLETTIAHLMQLAPARGQQSVLAQAHAAHARLHQRLNQRQTAEQSFAKAQQILGFLSPRKPREQALLTSLLFERGQLASDRKDFVEADEIYRLAADALAERCRQEPKRPDVWESRALCELLRGENRERRQLNEEAAAHYQQALDHFREMLNCLYGDPYLNENVAVARINLARLAQDKSPEDAIHHLTAAKDELVGLIQRDGPRQARIGMLQRCLQLLVDVQLRRGVEVDQDRQLLEALKANPQ